MRAGIGFKAVYRRFRRVTVGDGAWRFRYDEPREKGPGEPSHAWVMRPAPLALEKSDDTRCRFELERPRGAIDEDLRPPALSAVTAAWKAAPTRVEEARVCERDVTLAGGITGPRGPR